MRDPLKILVINQQALGDVTLSLPALRDLAAWKKQGENRDVMFVVQPDYASWIGSRIPTIKVFGKRKQEMLDSKSIQFFKAWNPDTVIDLDTTRNVNNLKLAYRLGVKNIVSSDCMGKSNWADVAVKIGSISNNDIHVTMLYRKIVAPVVGDLKESFACIGSETANNRLFNLPLKIGIHPGTNVRGKARRWPVEEMANLVKRIANRWGCEVYLFGTSVETNDIKELKSKLGNYVKALYVNQTVEDFAKTLGGMDVLLCNNSGPMHVAVELGVASISIQGPSSLSFYPAELENHLVLHSDLPCLGCEDPYSCTIGVACMTNYKAKDAWPKVERFIAGLIKNERQ